MGIGNLVRKLLVLSSVIFFAFSLCTTNLHRTVLAQGDTWETKAPMPTARQAAAAVEVNGRLYVVGGNRGCDDIDASLAIYDPAMNSWTAGAPLPTPRWAHAAGVIAGKLYVAGGASGCSSSSAVNTLYMYDPALNTWTTKAPMPTARYSLSAGVINNKLYIVGGAGVAGGSVLSTLEIYDPATDTWTAGSSMPTARHNLAVGVAGGKLYAVGGYNGGSLTTVEVYDSSANTWTSAAPLPSPRFGMGNANVIGGQLYIAGGGNDTTPNTNSLFVYDPASNVWESKTPMPTARVNASSSRVNDKLYVAGGIGNGIFLNTLEVYTPTSTSQCIPPPSNQNLWLPFDETSGTSAADISGRGNSTVLKLGAAFTPDGKVAGALDLSPANSFVEVTANGTGLDYQDWQKQTIDFWLNWGGPRNLPALRQYIWDNGAAGTGTGYALVVIDEVGGPGGAGFKAVGHDATGVPSPERQAIAPLPSIGVWEHYACIFDKPNGQISIYKNGALAAQVTWAPYVGTSSGAKTIGTSSPNSLKGKLDEFEIKDDALSVSEIQAIYNAGSAGKCKPAPECVPPLSGMMGWWPGDGSTEDIVDGNDGTMSGNVTFVAGRVGQAFQLQGVLHNPAIVNFGNAPNLRVSDGDFTVDAWMLPFSLCGIGGCNKDVVTKMGAAPNLDGWRVFLQGGAPTFCVGGGFNGCGPGAPLTVMDQAGVPLNQWTHIAAVKSSNTISIYVNGMLKESKAIPAFVDTHSADLVIGSYLQEGTFFDGIVDEVGIYNRALSAADIQAIYNAGSAGKCKHPTNTSPVAQCQDVTVSADASCAASASINNGSFDPDGHQITLSQSPSGPYPIGSTQVTLTVTDSQGASSQCTATVTVVDDAPPAVSCPATPIEVSVGADCQAVVPDATGSVMASDNCTHGGSLLITQNPAAGTQVGLGAHTINVTATDAAGNSNQCSVTLNVVDTTPPTITCPNNISVTANLGSNGAAVNYSATPSDNCGPASVACSPPSGSSFPVGTTTITCTATDAGSNAVGCTFSITVLSPQQATQSLINSVNNLVSQGTLNQGQGNSLTSKLDAAIQKMNEGNGNAARNQFQAFINQVNALMNSGSLSASEGQALIDAANNLIGHIP